MVHDVERKIGERPKPSPSPDPKEAYPFQHGDLFINVFWWPPLGRLISRHVALSDLIWIHHVLNDVFIVYTPCRPSPLPCKKSFRVLKK